MRELLTNYGPIAADLVRHAEGASRASRAGRCSTWCTSCSPTAWSAGGVGNALGDYAAAGDNAIPAARSKRDWETPATINDTWGYKTDDHNWKSAEDLIRKLVDIASKGGNYLLNVGPTAEGVIPQPSVERLLAMGELAGSPTARHLRDAGRAVAGVPCFRTTTAGSKVYLHMFDWPAGQCHPPAAAGRRSPRLSAGRPHPHAAPGAAKPAAT